MDMGFDWVKIYTCSMYSVVVSCNSDNSIRSTKNYFIKPLLLKAGQINSRREKMTVTMGQ